MYILPLDYTTQAIPLLTLVHMAKHTSNNVTQPYRPPHSSIELRTPP